MPRLLTKEELNDILSKMYDVIENNNTRYAESILTNMLVTMGYTKRVKLYYNISINAMDKSINERLKCLRSDDD
jgi:hypothetical protein